MKKRILFTVFSVILALLLCTALLSGCGKKTDVPATTEAVTTGAPDTPQFDIVEKFALITDGTAVATVIRPENSKEDSPEISGAVELRKYLMTYTKYFPINTDWTVTGEYDRSSVEIVFGESVYEESASVSAGGLGSYVIEPVGNKIIVKARTADGYHEAVLALENLIESAKTGAEGSISIALDRSVLSVSKVFDEELNVFPEYSEGKFVAAGCPGASISHELVYENASADGFRRYMGELEKAGFTKYTETEITGNIFATFYNTKTTLNVGFYKYNSNVRIVMEPFSQATLIGLESDNKYTAVTTSQMTMIGLEHVNSSGAVKGNGMCIMMRLSDGRFIVIDGGFNRAEQADNLIRQLKEQSKDYIGSGRITIAAWIITHPHGDHWGVFNYQTSKFTANKIVVQRLINNCMTMEEFARSAAKYPDNYDGDGNGSTAAMFSAAKTLDCTPVTAHVGQIYYFADLKIEVLYTLESHFPLIMNAVNAQSLIMKMTFHDSKTNKDTVYMSLGDSTGAANAIAVSTFGDYLRCNLGQVAHHGYSTWKNDAGTIAIYKKMVPETVVWPQGSSANPSYQGKAYNQAIFTPSSNPNYKEMYVAGKEGDVIIFPMPYTVGSATVSRVQK